MMTNREDASRTARGQPGSDNSMLDTAADCRRDAAVDTLGADAGAGPAAANFAAFLKGGFDKRRGNWGT